MWKYLKKQIVVEDNNVPHHPLALRIHEIEQAMERGFWDCNGGKVAGAFAVVAQMLAEQEARIQAIEDKQNSL